MRKKVYSLLIVVALSALLILLDQLTKQWAVRALMNAEDIILIPGVFQLHYLENRGMAFGLLQDQRILFIAVTIPLLLIFLWFTWKTPEKKRFLPIYAVIVLLMAGAVGNFIDRVFAGYVVDFLYFSLIDFPVFNVADIYVTVSSLCLFVLILFVYKDEELAAVYGRKKKDE